MIAKITKGTRPGDIAAYLHGPGRKDEHKYRDGNRVYDGGRVIGGNLGREGDTDGRRWAADMRAAIAERERKTSKPIWHVSLRNTADDRRLTDQEWADAGQRFAERMGYADNPWVMIRHGDDHVHIVASRVNERGELWADRHDYRKAQTASRELEERYGLTQAPRTKEQAKEQGKVRMPQREANERRRREQEELTERRNQPKTYAEKRTEREERRTASEVAQLEKFERDRARTPEERHALDQRKAEEAERAEQAKAARAQIKQWGAEAREKRERDESRSDVNRDAAEQRSRPEAEQINGTEERKAEHGLRRLEQEERSPEAQGSKSRREQMEETLTKQRNERDQTHTRTPEAQQKQRQADEAEQPKSRRQQIEETLAKQREERDQDREMGNER